LSGASRTDFWKFWAGQTISQLGSSFTAFALPLLVYKLTGSSVSLAIGTAAYFLPYLLFGLVIGAWVDRVDRRRMMIAVDLGRALVIAVIPILAYADALSVWWIYGGAFVISTLTIAFDSGEFAALPNLVSKDDLVTANGRLQASYSAAMIVGPLLAGVLLAVVEVETVFIVDAASFVASGISLALVRTSFNPDELPERKHILHDVGEGLRYVLHHPVLRNISLMMALINFVSATAFTQLVLFASVELDASDTQIAVLYAAGAAGVVCLGLSAGRLRRRLSFSVAALGAMMLEGVLGILFGLNNVFAVGLVLWAAISGLGLFFNINTVSLRQQIVPSHMLGRVVSIASVLAWSAIPLGALLGGWAIEATDDVALVYAVIGALTFVIAFAFRFTALGRADDYLEAPEEAAATEPDAMPDPAVATRGGG
jgi:predicted MFS family arabinose efflux permease